MERTYESAIALASRATGPLATHLRPWVISLIDNKYVAAVVYVKARHAAALDRWLTTQRIDLEDLSEVHLAQYQDRRRRVRRPVCVATRQQERRELVHLLRELRELGVCSTGRVGTTPSDDLAADFGTTCNTSKAWRNPRLSATGRSLGNSLWSASAAAQLIWALWVPSTSLGSCNVKPSA